MKRALLVAAVLGLTAAAAPPAHAKEGVTAHLENRLSLKAKPGTTVRVTWSLYVLEHGEKRPFGASGLFVRARGKGGTFAKAYDEGGTNNRYTARLKVPRGGLASIRFGLDGTRTMANGDSEYAPAYFPLDNDPFD